MASCPKHSENRGCGRCVRCSVPASSVKTAVGDSPKCIISMDVLAPGSINFTEVRIMPITAFREFVMSEKLMFNLP